MQYVAIVILILYGIIKLIIWILKVLAEGIGSLVDAFEKNKSSRSDNDADGMSSTYKSAKSGTGAFIEESEYYNQYYQDNYAADGLSNACSPSTNTSTASPKSDTSYSEVEFLNRVELQIAKENVPHKILLMSPSNVGLVAWHNSLITCKEDINVVTPWDVKKSYITIRNAFLNGRYFNLSSADYSAYSKILLFDIKDAIRNAHVASSEYKAVVGAIHLMAGSNNEGIYTPISEPAGNSQGLISSSNITSSSQTTFEQKKSSDSNAVNLLVIGERYNNLPNTINVSLDSYSLNDSPKDKVEFLTGDDINSIVIPNEIITESHYKYTDVISPWTDDVYCKEHINEWTSASVKKSYRLVRENFLHGVYIDLITDEYASYAKVLLWDVMDAMCHSKLDEPDLKKIFKAIRYMYPFREEASRYIKRNKNIALKEAIVLRTFMACFPQSQETYSWADFGLHYLNITSKDYNLLRKLGYYVRLSRNVTNYPNLRKLIIAMFLEVMRQEKPVDTSIAKLLSKREYTEGYVGTFYEDFLQIALDIVLCHAKKEPLNVKRDFPYSLDKVIKANFPCDIVDCFKKSFERHLPLPMAIWKDLYRMDNQIWKARYDEIKGEYKLTHDYDTFIAKADVLAERTSDASNVHMLYIAIIREISKDHKTKSLLYYFKARVVNDNSKIAKTDMKYLFPTEDKLQQFEFVLQQYRSGKTSLEEANEFIMGFYPEERFTRRKIQISADNLQQKEEQFKQTVSLLGNIMNEEDPTVPSQQEVEMASTQVTQVPAPAPAQSQSKTSSYQNLFDAFKYSDYHLSSNEVQAFAKKSNKMIGVYIDEINETYFELLDDNLIEENEDGYSIEPSYLQNIENNE